MLCNKCGKYSASILNGEGELAEGLCLLCAYRYRIEPIKSLTKSSGMTDMDIEKITRAISQEDLRKAEILRQQKEKKQMEQNSLTHANPQINGKDCIYNSGQHEEEREQTSTNLLDDVCINMTKRAAEKLHDTMVGRKNEMDRVIQILCRHSKNNPCLIGEPGVGKTAIVEGLCQRIAKGDVPSDLRGKEVYLLELSSLVAGTQYRGQFEARMKQLMTEVRKRGNVILFIDEVHNMVGTGGNESSMNAANILKPALSRGEIQLIGATTLSEYRKNIERDGALERRFQPVIIEEPSIEEACEILYGAKERFERHHGVIVDDSVVDFAVYLSERYITDRNLPDKAIDLLDEGCVLARLRSRTNIKLTKLLKEQEKLAAAMAEILKRNGEDAIQEVRSLQMMASDMSGEVEKLKKCKQKIRLTEEHLAEVIESWTKIPASRVSKNEMDRLLSLGERLKSRIVNQDTAIDVICSGIKRNRAGLSPKRKPVSMIFAGPTGVGKTELVKVLSLDLFDTPDSLIRLDMSEFMEKHSISRILGAPPGYLGYDDAGQLTEKVRRKPYSVVLFDEIEKAHPDVLNILLQILDDGRISDSHGKTVNFENCIIIMTTNAGFSTINDNAQDISQVLEALYKFLRPEFINRVDDIVLFNRLSKDNFKDICRIILDDIKQSANNRGLEFSYTDEAVTYLAHKSYSDVFGARALRRIIQREVENPLADIIIGFSEEKIKNVYARYQDGIIVFDKE